MTLMTERCASSVHQAQARDSTTPLVAFRNPGFGAYMPTYFYINQKRPLPMEPLKVKNAIYHLSS